MKHAGDDSAHAVVETLDGVGVDRTACILPVTMADSVMGGECLPDGHEGLPFIAHQVR